MTFAERVRECVGEIVHVATIVDTVPGILLSSNNNFLTLRASSAVGYGPTGNVATLTSSTAFVRTTE